MNLSTSGISGVSTLVIGPGWLGTAIVAALAGSGGKVWTMRRRTIAAAGEPERLGPGSMSVPVPVPVPVRAVYADVTAIAGAPDSDNAFRAVREALPNRIDAVVLCVAPSRARGDTHNSLYPAAARGAVRLADELGARTLLHVSSTGVYGETAGQQVREFMELVATDARQRALLDAERIILGADATKRMARVVLRVAGLYGPARDPSLRFLNADSLYNGGRYWCNFAWRDDVVAAVMHLLARAMLTECPHCFNCADGNPVLARDVARALGASRSAPSPAQGDSASRAILARSNQRVSIERLLATGWAPRVPSVYHGLALLGHPVTPP